MKRTLVTVATYNEMENLPRLVQEVFRIAPEVELLVIDDNSPDGTGRWCDEAAGRELRLQCLHREAKQGLGAAIIAGMQYALARGYDQVLNMDADFSHHPRYLPDVLGCMEKTVAGKPVDVAIGSRYIPGGAIEGWPWRRHFISRAVNAYARGMLGLSVRDCSGGYRCYRASALQKLDFSRIRSRGYSFQEEILFDLVKHGAVVCETPITFADRERGQSKINGREALAALAIILRLGIGRLTAR